jgi:hypothetical protein
MNGFLIGLPIKLINVPQCFSIWNANWEIPPYARIEKNGSEDCKILISIRLILSKATSLILAILNDIINSRYQAIFYTISSVRHYIGTTYQIGVQPA